MKRTDFLLLLAGVLMTSIFVITGCTANRDGFLTAEQLLTGQQADQVFGSAEPQLEPFDKALEESKEQVEARLAQEKRLQLEPFDRAVEESREQLKLAKEKGPQLEPFDKAVEESREQFKVAQEKEWETRTYSLVK